MREHINKKKVTIIVIIALLAIVALVFFLFRGKIRATTMRLLRIEGTVTMQEDGKNKDVKQNLRLKSGNSLDTASSSLVSIGLDDFKIVTMDELSRAEFNQKGKYLNLNLTKGSIYFEVDKPLASDESFEIETSTMVVGIRGTSGWVSVSGEHESLIITDGHVHVIGTNPVTGEVKEIDVKAGQRVSVYLYNDRTVDSIMFELEDIKERDLPEFVLNMLRDNISLLDRVIAATNWDKPWILGIEDAESETDPDDDNTTGNENDVTQTVDAGNTEPDNTDIDDGQNTDENDGGSGTADVGGNDEKTADDDKPVNNTNNNNQPTSNTVVNNTAPVTVPTQSALDQQIEEAKKKIVSENADGTYTLSDGTVFDPGYYANRYPDVADAYGTEDDELLAHYVSTGQDEGRYASNDEEQDALLAVAIANASAENNSHDDSQDDTDNDQNTNVNNDTSQNANTNTNTDTAQNTNTSTDTSTIQNTNTSTDTSTTQNTNTSTNTSANTTQNTSTNTNTNTTQNTNTSTNASTNTSANTTQNTSTNTNTNTTQNTNTSTNTSTNTTQNTNTNTNTNTTQNTNTNTNTNTSQNTSTNTSTNTTQNTSTNTSTNTNQNASTNTNTNTTQNTNTNTNTNTSQNTSTNTNTNTNQNQNTPQVTLPTTTTASNSMLDSSGNFTLADGKTTGSYDASTGIFTISTVSDPTQNEVVVPKTVCDGTNLYNVDITKIEVIPSTVDTINTTNVGASYADMVTLATKLDNAVQNQGQYKVKDENTNTMIYYRGVAWSGTYFGYVASIDSGTTSANGNPSSSQSFIDAYAAVEAGEVYGVTIDNLGAFLDPTNNNIMALIGTVEYPGNLTFTQSTTDPEEYTINTSAPAQYGTSLDGRTLTNDGLQ